MTEQANAAGAEGAAGAAAAAAAQAQAGGPGAAAAQGAQAAAAGANGADGKWYGALNLPKEAAEFIDTQGWKGVDEITRDYRLLQGKIGAKGLLVPAPDAPAEEWAKFYKAVPGYPEDPAKYNVPVAPGAQPSEFEKRWETAMRPAFHKAGLSQRQVEVLINEGYMPFARAEIEQQTTDEAQKRADDERARDEFLKTLGGEKPASEKERLEFVALGQRAVQDLFKGAPAEQRDAMLSLVNEKLGTPAFLKLFGEIGRRFYREGSGALNPGAQPGDMTGAQAKVELDKMKADPNVAKIMQDPRHPQYAATLKKWDDLLDQIGREEDRQRAAA